MKQILIIEDEGFLRDNIVALLEMEGFAALGAESGEQGVALARERLPDLIIADIMMPGLDGYGVLRELRSFSATATIPFIFMTAKNTHDDVRRGMELGADDYITKPFRSKELIAAVHAQFEKQATLENARLRSLSHYLVEAQEAERSRVVHELDHEVSQLLSGLKMTLGLIKRLPPEAGHTVLDEALQVVDAILERIKYLSRDLRPAILDALGLLPALRQFIDQFSASSKGQVVLTHAGSERRFSNLIEIVAYRIVQKTVEEIIDSAPANTITVHIEVQVDTLLVEISDDNNGFDLNTALNINPAAAFVELYERVALVGGQLLIESSPDTHTRVVARLPLTGPANRAITPLQLAEPEILPHLTPRIVPSLKPAASQTEEPMLRVVVADAHDLMRRGIHKLFETAQDIVVVAELAQVGRVVDVVGSHKPDLVVLDPVSAEGSRLDLLSVLATRFPQTRILVLSTRAEAAFVAEALRCGATGYALKESSVDDLLQAVWQVAEGERYLSPALFADAVAAYLNADELDTESAAYIELTQRELEVLRLVAEGFTSVEIAGKLSISPRTVETHRANMMRKLNVHSQAGLIRYALDHNLTTDD